MPRIYDSANNPIDFCRHCFPKDEAAAERQYGDVAKTGEGPDERGNCFAYEAEHPDYSDTDYECEKCHKPLKDRDN
jgi:hypothetical protein